MECVAAVNEVLALVSTTRELCQSLTQRVDNFSSNPGELQNLKDELENAENKIRICDAKLKNYREAIATQSLEYELNELQGSKNKMQRVEENVEELTNKLSPKGRLFKKFFRAKNIAQEVSRQVQTVKEVSLQMDNFNEKLKAIAEENDVFRADFSSIPKLRGPVSFDFNTTDTVEGRLKAMFLESVERPESSLQNDYAHVTAAVGVGGMGGVGKTTALVGLAKDEEVQKKFSDGGIYFIVVGKDATDEQLITKLKNVVMESGGSRCIAKVDTNGSLESAIRVTSSWFANRRALFICDDLWQTSSCETGYFESLVGLLDRSPKSSMIISTRSNEIARKTKAPVLFEPRSANEARGIFLANTTLNEQEIHECACEDLVKQVLELCGGVPLMLSIAGAQVQKRRELCQDKNLNSIKASLKNLLASLKKVSLPTMSAVPTEGQYPSSFNQAIQGSLETIATLSETSDEFMKLWREYSTTRTVVDFVIDCFQRLCVLPRSARVSEEVIFGIWCLTSETFGWKVKESLVEFHLLLESVDTEGKSSFGLHDVILDYCEKASRCAKGDKYKMYHKDFLGHAWVVSHKQSTCTPDVESSWVNCDKSSESFWDPEAYAKSRPWWRVLLCQNESSEIGKYLLGNLFRHLKESGRLIEAVGLLSNAGWTELRVAHGGIVALNGDFSLVKSEIESYRAEERDKKACDDALLEITRIWDMVRRAWPVLLRNSEALSTHAYGYLLDKKENMSMVQRYLDSTVDIMTGPWLKPENAFWSMLDSSSDGPVFRTGEYTVDIALLTRTKKIIIATQNALFWIEIDTMRTTREIAIRNVKEDTSGISAFAYCEAKGVIVLGFRTKELEIRNEKSGNVLITVLNAHNDRVECVAISADARTIVSGSYDKTVRVWNTDTGTPVGQPLCGHDGRVECVAISADARTIVSGSSDKTVRVWNTDTGTPVGQPLCGHDGLVSCIAISTDARTIVSGSYDNTVRVWNYNNSDRLTFLHLKVHVVQ